MRKILMLIAIGVGVWYWTQGDLPFMSRAGAFDDNGNPVVWVFTVKECGTHCKQGLQELKMRKIPYREIEINPVNQDDENVKLWKKLGRGAFPFVVAGNSSVIGTSKSQLATMLGNNFGDEYLTRAEKKYFKKHFYEDGSPKIVLYGADWCGFCQKLMGEFKSEGIDFVYINVETHADRASLVKVMDIPGYPATWVGFNRAKGSTLRDVKAAY